MSPRHINIVMDYASGGSLFAFVQQRRQLKEPYARWFFQQLVLAVDYCHKKGVANRDIKLENTLLQLIPGLPRPLVKICDFGYSKHDNRSVAKSKVGTLTYMAPEVMISKDAGYNGKRADIWSCGVVLYTMLVGKYPFQCPGDNGRDDTMAQAVVAMLQKMRNREYQLPEHISLECQDLIHGLLHPDHERRINMEGIMAHPWFKAELPPDALTMNARYLASSKPCQQTDYEIRAIVERAINEDVNLHELDQNL